MRKGIVLFGFIVSHVLYADYEGRLPSSITLGNGQSQSHNLTPTCVNMRGCNFGYNWASGGGGFDFSYTTSSGSSNLTFNAVMPQETFNQKNSVFYVNNFYVGANSHLTITNFSSFLVNSGRNFSLGNNASFTITLQKDVPGVSNSQMVFYEHSTMNLGNNSKMIVKNASKFMSNGAIHIQENALLDVSSTNISLTGSMVNKGSVVLSGSVLSVGVEGVMNAPSISSITNYGNITINGNMQNGGMFNASVNEKGGGIITNYGGTITITGKLDTQSEGGKTSSVNIYGGTLQANGGITNGAGSKVTIGAYNGEMGKIEGSVTNNGSIIIDTAGSTIGSHQVITGNVSGGGSVGVLIRNGADEFISATLTNGTLKVDLDTTKVNAFESTLTGNEKDILHALNSQLNGIYTYGGSTLLRNTTQSMNQGLASTFIHTPLAMLDSMQTHPTYFSDTSTLSVGAWSSGILGKNAGVGGIGGIRAHYAVGFGAHNFASSVSYGYGSLQQDFNLYTGTLQSHALSASLTDRIRFNRFILDIGVRGAIGFFNANESLDFTGVSMPMKGCFTTSIMRAQATFGYPIVAQNLIMKPTIGIAQDMIMQGAYTNASQTQLESNGYDNFLTNLIFGIHLAYQMSGTTNLFANCTYEPTIYASQKQATLSLNQQSIRLDTMASVHNLHAQAGMHFQINANMAANLQAFYNLHHTQSHIFGLQANFGYQF